MMPSEPHTSPSRGAPRGIEPIRALSEMPTVATGRTCAIPALVDMYDGPLTIPLRDDRPTVIANFVQTIDGVVTLDPDGREGSGAVSGFSPTDRSVMGLLRAMAEVVLVGAGTVRASRGSGWGPGGVYPPAAAAFCELRARLGLTPEPMTLVVTAHGDLDPGHPAFLDPHRAITIAAPATAAHRLRLAGFRDGIAIEELGDGDVVTPEALVALASRMGARVMLTEGGPHLAAGLAAAGLIDELFLTVAPQLVGRDRNVGRLGLIEGAALWPGHARWAELASVRRAGGHLFLRYRFTEGES